MTQFERPAILTGEARDLITDPRQSLLGNAERESLLAAFDAAAARGGREGDEIEVFERALADKFGVASAVATVSATAGLAITLQAYGIGHLDEVIVSPYTFAASGHAIVHVGATPVFADIELETLCLSASEARARITQRTKAILVVQIGGKPGPMRELRDLAAAYELKLIEDAAQAHGAKYEGHYVGTLGDAGVLSFSPKLMTSFRGGAILCKDEYFTEQCRRWRFHGLPGHRDRVRKQVQLTTGEEHHFVHELPGFSLAMTPLQAALLMPQLARLDEAFERRHTNGTRFAKGLAQINGISPVIGGVHGRSNFYMLEALYDGSVLAGLTRDEFVAALSWEGVPVSPVSVTRMLQYDNPSLARFVAQRCPVAESVMGRLLVFGHPLQSLILQADESLVDRALEAVARVARHAEEIAAHFKRGQAEPELSVA